MENHFQMNKVNIWLRNLGLKTNICPFLIHFMQSNASLIKKSMMYNGKNLYSVEQAKLSYTSVVILSSKQETKRRARRNAAWLFWTKFRKRCTTGRTNTETYGVHDLKNLSVFLNVKKAEDQARQGNKGLCFVCDCNSGAQSERTNAQTAAAGGTGSKKTRAFLIHFCCL